MGYFIVPAIAMLFDIADYMYNNPVASTNTLSSSVIEIPMIVSDDIAIDAVGGYAKYMEINCAYMIKSLVEGSERTRFDSDIRSIMRQLPVRTGMDDKLLDRFGLFIKSLFGSKNRPKVDKYIAAFAEAARAELSSKGISIDTMKVSGEGMDAIYSETRLALPTYVTASVTVNNLGRTYTKNITIGISCKPKRVSPEEMAGFFLENRYDILVKGTQMSSKEKNSWSLFKANSSFLKKRLSSDPDTKDLGNRLSAIFKKIEGSTKPFVGILMSNYVFDLLIERKFNIFDINQYNKIVNRFPILSIGIFDMNIDAFTYSIGETANFDRKTSDEINSDISKFEKEFRNVMQFNKYN